VRLSRRAVVAGLVMLPSGAVAQSKVRIAAAADLRSVLDPMVKAFAARTNHELTVTYGSTGNLMRQIGMGAPFEVFLSADESYAMELVKAGKTDGEGVIYAVGRLALIVRKGSEAGADTDLKGVANALVQGKITRFAIANPEHAPYGARAKEVLEKAGLWEKIRARIVFGENVAQAAQIVATGAAEAGLVAVPMTKTPEMAKVVDAVVIPQSMHAPLRQRMVLVKGASEAARAFYAEMQTPGVREALKSAGFDLP
jgi:molybdate transport system substrate-binding protein